MFISSTNCCAWVQVPPDSSVKARNAASAPSRATIHSEFPSPPCAPSDDFATATTELFGPFQVLVRWTDGQLPLVLDALNTMQNHLTAGVVSGDIQFINEVLANTISGTT